MNPFPSEATLQMCELTLNYSERDFFLTVFLKRKPCLLVSMPLITMWDVHQWRLWELKSGVSWQCMSVYEHGHELYFLTQITVHALVAEVIPKDDVKTLQTSTWLELCQHGAITVWEGKRFFFTTLTVGTYTGNKQRRHSLTGFCMLLKTFTTGNVFCCSNEWYCIWRVLVTVARNESHRVESHLYHTVKKTAIWWNVNLVF